MVPPTRIELVMTGYQPIVIPFNYRGIIWWTLIESNYLPPPHLLMATGLQPAMGNKIQIGCGRRNRTTNWSLWDFWDTVSLSRDRLADWTGLEPATPCVTGMCANQLRHQSKFCDTICKLYWLIYRSVNPPMGFLQRQFLVEHPGIEPGMSKTADLQSTASPLMLLLHAFIITLSLDYVNNYFR